MNFSYEKYMKQYQKTPRGRYNTHRANAQRREIPWKFTFESWWKMWEESGKWEERGRKDGQYVMCRTGDIGDYSPENVRIKKMNFNSSSGAKRRWAARRELDEHYGKVAERDLVKKWKASHDDLIDYFKNISQGA